MLSFSHLFLCYVLRSLVVWSPCPDTTRRGIPHGICVHDGQHRSNRSIAAAAASNNIINNNNNQHYGAITIQNNYPHIFTQSHSIQQSAPRPKSNLNQNITQHTVKQQSQQIASLLPEAPTCWTFSSADPSPFRVPFRLEIWTRATSHGDHKKQEVTYVP